MTNFKRIPFRLSLKSIIGILDLILSELFYSLKRKLGIVLSKEEELSKFILSNEVDSDSQSILDAMDQFGWKKGFLMNVGEEKGLILEGVIKETNAKRVLELGVYMGYSTIRIANCLKESGQVTSIELNKSFLNKATEHIRKSGLFNKVELIHAKASQAITSLEGKFDVIFIDHWKDMYLQDLKLIEEHNLMKHGTRVVADNITMFNSDEYLQYVRNNENYESKYYPAKREYSRIHPDGVEISTYILD